MNNDRVAYQVEKATAALREALKYGAADLSPYQLANIVDALKELDNAGFYFKATKATKPELVDPGWQELLDRTSIRPGFKFNADVEFVSAVSE